MKWENKGHEYDGFGEVLFNPQTKYYIWGAGTFGKAFYDRFSREFSIVGFIDRNPAKWGSNFCGKKVYSPSDFEAVRKDEIILVSTGLTRSAYKSLEEMQCVRHMDYFHIDEAASIYEFKKNNRLYLNDVDVGITQKCSLRCEHCNAFIPLLKTQKDQEIEDIKISLQKYFKWVDEVNILSLSGGDAMMHRGFNEILEWIGESYYPKRVNNIEVYCNAVIIPDEKTIELFKKYNVIYRFTDYHGRAGTQKIPQVESLLNSNGIAYDHADLESWYDCGYPQETNGIHNEEALVKFCTLCDRKSCHGLWHNKLFLCYMCKCAADIGYCEVKPTDYFDLDEYSADKKIELLEYYMGYSEMGYYNYCRKCNGGMNVNTHKISQGEQIKN